MTESSDDETPLTDQAIEETLTSMMRRFDAELYALTEAELTAQWYFRWDSKRSLASNVYEFNDHLDMIKTRCRRWETHHHGSALVVERVRDKYLMPRIREFLVTLQTHILLQQSAKTV